jgi:hypothetical protein
MIEGYISEADTLTRWWRSILESATSAFSVRVHTCDEVGAETESCYAVDHETPRPDIHEIRVSPMKRQNGRGYDSSAVDGDRVVV